MCLSDKGFFEILQLFGNFNKGKIIHFSFFHIVVFASVNWNQIKQMAVCKTIQIDCVFWLVSWASKHLELYNSRGTEKANQYVYLYKNKYLLGQQKINFQFLNKNFDILNFYNQQTPSTSLSSVWKLHNVIILCSLFSKTAPPILTKLCM